MTATQDRTPAYNSTYKKLAVQWLYEALCLVSSSVVADSFRLRNRQCLKRFALCTRNFGINLVTF